MDSLKVNAAGLSILADSCRAWSAEAGATVGSIGTGSACKATSAVVAAVHGDAGVAASALAARLQETAERLSAAGIDFTVGEQAKVGGFEALGR